MSSGLTRRVTLEGSEDLSSANNDEHDVEEQLLEQLSQELEPPKVDYTQCFEDDEDSRDFDELAVLAVEKAEQQHLNSRSIAGDQKQPASVEGAVAQNTPEDSFRDIPEADMLRIVHEAEQKHAAATNKKKEQLAESSKEPPLAKKQKKITDIFSTASTSRAPGAASNCPKDTEDQMFSDNRLYKKGETWLPVHPNPKSDDFKGISVAIQKFDFKTINKRRRKVAECEVYIELSETFIGPEATRLVEGMEKKGIAPGADYNKARCVNTNMLEEGRYMPLKLLKTQLSNTRPRPALVYDAGPKKSNGNGCNFCYRFVDSPTSVRDAPTLKSRNPAVLELFAGGGGMSLAFKLEGFQVQHLVEINPSAAATLELHKQEGCYVHAECVREFLRKCKEDRLGIYPKPFDFVHGHLSPPCDGLSLANRNGGQNDDANNELTYSVIANVEYFQFRTVSMENVTGMILDKKKRVYLQKVVTGLLLLEYQVRVSVVSSADYGDPQARPRIFLLGARRDCKLPDLPTPTHSKDGSAGTQRHVAVKEVLLSLETVEPVLGSGLVALEDGSLVWNHNREGRDLKEPKNMHRLVAHKPANTIRRQNEIQHYSLPRCLTVRERARIQSFPDNYKFQGTTAEQMEQIGNAVPVMLGRAMAKSIMNSYRWEE